MRARAFLMIGGLLVVGMSVGNEPVPATLQQTMQQVVAPQSQMVWNITNAALTDAGELDAAKITPADWKQLLAAAMQLKDAAKALAQRPHIVVASPGQKIQDEENAGASSARQVQYYIDRDLQAFHMNARKLEANADKLIAAAMGRNATTLSSASADLDSVCERCHQRFWYPQQSKK